MDLMFMLEISALYIFLQNFFIVNFPIIINC